MASPVLDRCVEELFIVVIASLKDVKQAQELLVVNSKDTCNYSSIESSAL
jgi:hypothetical protein